MRRLGIVVLVLALIGGGYLYLRHRDAPQEPATQPTPQVTTVDVQGGTFTFPDEVSVVVPAGAVTEPTELAVSAPVVLKPTDAGPLKGMRSSGVRFDVSLKRGAQTDIQPLKPLLFRVPTGKGRYAPLNAKSMHALAYTDVKPRGYRLQLAAIAKQTLTITMGHLSPKYIVYVSDAELLKSFDADAATSSPDSNCAQQLQVGDQRVYFGDRSTGWSLKPNSPLFACLIPGSEGYVRVGVINRIDYILPVAATSDVRLEASTGDAETEAIKSLARNIFKIAQVKKYVGQDEKLVGSIAIDDLPATIELQGDPHTFLAEAVWRALTVSVAVFIGEDSDEATKLVKALIETVSVIGCLQEKLQDKGKKPDWLLVGRTMTDCSGPILEELARHIPKLDPLKRAQAVWSMIRDLNQSLWRSANGIKLQFNGTMRVQILATAPPINDAFVGEWRIHGVQLTIRKDGTGHMEVHGGCGENSELAFRQGSNGKLYAKYTRVWCSFGDIADEEYATRVGDTFWMQRDDPGVLIAGGGRADDPDGPGNPYLCKETALNPKCD